MYSRRPAFQTLCIFFAVTVLSATANAAKVMAAELIADGFKQPTYICSEPNDASRLYVLERSSGKILLIKNGVLQSKPFLNIGDRVSSDRDGEQGLFNLVFPPNFGPDNKFFYVCYSDIFGASIVEAYKIGSNPDKAKKGSAKQILEIQGTENIHFAGQMAFGPDGNLYVGRGDGGPADDPLGRGQDKNILLGKLLRIKVNKDKSYKVPTDNPFVGQSNVKTEIWAYGLRNPWRFSFDRLTGDLYIADVGQNWMEEIDFQPASSTGGENYGWNIAEGLECQGGGGTCGTNAGFTPPIHQYGHTGGVAVIGGYVYRGNAIPEMQGRYFFADHGFTTISSFINNAGTVTDLQDHTNELEPDGSNTINSISSFGEDADGELYIVDIGDGEIYKIVPRP
ncbi:MAG: PQQ-dependent sugar dehydrogenase [Candidatus Hydrogenedentes bacterium]|nr:PQQ-dependent sugar dehydrogenase [Candidatus Hydrogenedentota bacterium]